MTEMLYDPGDPYAQAERLDMVLAELHNNPDDLNAISVHTAIRQDIPESITSKLPPANGDISYLTNVYHVSKNARSEAASGKSDSIVGSLDVARIQPTDGRPIIWRAAYYLINTVPLYDGAPDTRILGSVFRNDNRYSMMRNTGVEATLTPEELAHTHTTGYVDEEEFAGVMDLAAELACDAIRRRSPN